MKLIRRSIELLGAMPGVPSLRLSAMGPLKCTSDSSVIRYVPTLNSTAATRVSKAAWKYMSSRIVHKLRSDLLRRVSMRGGSQGLPNVHLGLRWRFARAQSMLHRCFSSTNPTDRNDMPKKEETSTSKVPEEVGSGGVSKLPLDWRQQIQSIPNMITLARIAACPFIALAIANDMKKTALVACVAAGVSDWLDGYIAKNYNSATTLGAFLDPLADKIFIGSMAVGLTASGLLPWPVSVIVVGRDLLLVLGSFIIRAKEKRVADGFFDLSTTTFHIKPSLLSKANTFTQFVLLCSTFSSFALGWPATAMLEPLWYITSVTTIGSGLGYLNGSGLNRKKMTEMAKEFRRKTKK